MSTSASLIVLITNLLSKLKKKKLPLAPNDSRAFFMFSEFKDTFKVFFSCSELRLSLIRRATKRGSANDLTLIVISYWRRLLGSSVFLLIISDLNEDMGSWGKGML